MDIGQHEEEEGPVDLSAKYKSVAVQTEYTLNQLLALRLRQILLDISLEMVASKVLMMIIFEMSHCRLSKEYSFSKI